MHIYSKLLNEYGQIASQVLLTKDVIDDEQREELMPLTPLIPCSDTEAFLLLMRTIL